jgi:hypothetical protein
MKLAMTTLPAAQVRAVPRPTADVLYRLAGLIVAVVVPMAFWTIVVMYAATGLGFTVGVPALVAFAAVVGTWSLVGASLAMSNRT